jgi:hypothetical protein
VGRDEIDTDRTHSCLVKLLQIYVLDRDVHDSHAAGCRSELAQGVEKTPIIDSIR